MVKYQDPTLDRTFGALADPTRRALIARLGEGRGLSVSELAKPFPVSLPAIMKHLGVLSDAGLIVRTKVGRTVTCELSAAVMKSALDWLNRYERFWNEQLNRLEAYLEEDEFMSTATATKPSLTIKRRLKAPPAKVFAAWTDPEKLVRWFRPGDITDVQATIDPRTGGHYRISAKSPTDTHEVSGTYRELVPNEKLVFSWAWKSTPERQSLVTITLKADGDGTMLTLTHEQFFDEPARDRHNQGWTSALDKLVAYFE